MPFTGEALAERLRKFHSLEERGLVVRTSAPGGGVYLTFPNPRHPDILAFEEEGEALWRQENP